MKLLVTGGAGFIGSNFIPYVLENQSKDQIINFDKLTYAGNLENLKDVESSKNYKFIKGDICDFKELISAAVGADAIVHFAAESHVDRSIHFGHEFIETNIKGTQNVIDVVRELKIGKYLHISTDEVYGDIASPKKSKDGDAFNPSSPYSASKAASEVLVIAAIRTYGLPAIITRCTNNYGPYQHPEKIIPLFISNAIENKKLPVYDGGGQIRDWLYVEDHCVAIDLCLRRGKVGQAYDVASENLPEVTNLEITKMILKLMNKPETLIEHVSGLRPGHDQRYAVDSTKIRRELGWRPAVSLEQGLKKTVQWYLDNDSWWRNVKSGEYQDYYKKHYQSA